MLLYSPDGVQLEVQNASNPGGQSKAGEDVHNLYDGSDLTKWLDTAFNFAAGIDSCIYLQLASVSLVHVHPRHASPSPRPTRRMPGSMGASSNKGRVTS